MIVTPFAQVSPLKPLEAIFLLVLSEHLPGLQIKRKSRVRERQQVFQKTVMKSRWYETGLYCLAGASPQHHVWTCDRIRHPAGVAWLLRGMCVTLVLTLHSERSGESNTAGSCCSNLHAVADKAATLVRSGHRTLWGLSLCAESVFGCRWGDRHDIEESQWCHQNIRQGEGNASV